MEQKTDNCTCLIEFGADEDKVGYDEGKGIYELLKKRYDVTIYQKHKYVVPHTACLYLDDLKVHYTHIKKV